MRRREGARRLPVAALALLGLALVLLPPGPTARAQEPSQPPPVLQRFDPGQQPEPGERPGPGPQDGAGPAATAQAAETTDDPRSAVLVRRVCISDLDREELTVFANGTVRLRQGPPGEERMDLGEMAPDELKAWANQLREEDLGETEARGRGPEGAWVAACRLDVHYDALEHWLGPAPVREERDGRWQPRGSATYRYGRFDSLSLALSRVVGLVDGAAQRVDRAVGRGLLPDGYEPRRGDVLRRADGILFRVERSTASPGGWELQGVDQPLTLYLLEDDVPKLFVELVERGGRR